MPSLVHFYRLSPAEIWDLPIDELQALIAYRDAVAKQRKDPTKRARRR